jgi:hypothetical protein
MKNKGKKQLAVFIPEELKIEVQVEALHSRRYVTDIVIESLQDYLKKVKEAKVNV